MEKEWDAEITEQHPDERVAWRATSGAENAGVVTFHRIDDETTRVTLQLDADPEGLVENVGTALGFLDRRVKGDLERFKEYIESRGSESGAWRGDVEAPGPAVSGRTNPVAAGMTGATGDLTPDDADEPFVPAELRRSATRSTRVT